MASVCARKPLKRPRRLSAEEVKMLKLEVWTIGNVREVHPTIDVEHGDACLGEKEAEKRGDDTLPTTHVEYA